MHLVVQKKFKNKPLRSWKLNYKQGLYVAGSSRKSDIYLPWVSEPVWFGCQFVDQKWHLLNLSGALDGDYIVKPIDQKVSIQNGDVQIDLIPVYSRVVFAAEESEETTDNQFSENEPKDGQLGILCFKKNGEKLVGSQLLSWGQFKASFPQGAPSSRWTSLIESKETREKIYCKIVPLHPHLIKEIKREPRTHDKNILLIRIATAFTFILGIILYLFLPDEKSASEFAKSQIPPQINLQREVKTQKRERNQSVQGSAQLQTQPTKEVKPQPVPVASPHPPALSAQSRLSKILAKFNQQSTTSKHVIVVQEAVSAKETQLKSIDSLHQIGGSVTGKKIHDGSTAGIGVGTITEKGGAGHIVGQRLGKGGVSVADSLDEEADVDGGLDPEVISGVIRKHLGEILFCYERQLSANPNLYGKVIVRFTIIATGKVDSSRIVQSSLKNDFVENCINGRVLKWIFPPPKGGAKVVVTYPFLLKNSN